MTIINSTCLKPKFHRILTGNCTAIWRHCIWKLFSYKFTFQIFTTLPLNILYVFFWWFLDRFTILITVYYFILEDSTVKSWYKLKRVYLFWEIIGFTSHFLKVLVIFELNSKFPFCSPLEASSYIHIISIERVLPLSRSLSIYIYSHIVF